MFSDHCEANRFLGGGNIIYYINDIRVTREEFHHYRAEHGLTDFTDTEFAISPSYNIVTIGHWSSIINECTEEYLSSLGERKPYNFDEKTSFRICLLTLRDRFMTIERINYLYHRGTEYTYAKTACPLKKFLSCNECKHTPEDIRTCIDIDERKASDDAYNKMMMKDFRREEEEEWEKMLGVSL